MYIDHTTDITYYFNQIKYLPLLTREEEKTLAVKYYTEKCQDAAYRLITANLRFVVKMAYSYKKRFNQCDLKDLIQDGNIGLMKALKKFDPFKGIRFISFAVYDIRDALQKSIVNNHMILSGVAKSLTSNMFQRQGQKKLPHVQNLINYSHSDNFIDKDVIEENHVLLLSQDISVSEELEKKQENSLAQNLLSCLSDRERYIIQKNVMEDVPLEDVGKELKLSKQRVHQLKNTALKKLREQKI